MLESSLGERQAACAGEGVVFTCVVTGSGRLTWTIKPPQSNSIVFNLQDMNVRVGTRKLDSTGYFNAVVTNYSRDPNFTFLGDITSNLLVNASPESVLSVRNLTCSDGISTTVPSLLLTMAGLLRKYWCIIMLPISVDLPSYPQNVTYNITSYSVDEYSVRVQWEAPIDDGGVGVSSYTITMTTEGIVNASVEMTNATSQVASLQYNKSYMFEIAATNCNGAGQYASFNISAGTM